jgi:hypothetical protein
MDICGCRTIGSNDSRVGIGKCKIVKIVTLMRGKFILRDKVSLCNIFVAQLRKRLTHAISYILALDPSVSRIKYESVVIGY